MEGRRLWAFMAVLLLILPSAYAKSSSIDFEIWPDGTSEVHAKLIIDSRGVGTLSIPAEKAQFVSINDDQSVLKFVILDEELLIGLSREDVEYPLEMRYQTPSLTSKDGDRWTWTLRFDDEFWQGIETLAVVIKVPDQAMLITYTDGGVVYSKNGLHVGWRVNEPSSMDELEIQYRLESSAFFPNSPGENRKSLLLMVFGIIIGGILLWVAYDRLVRKVSSGKKNILDALDGKERRVMEHLMEKKKELTQIQIAKHTGLSKASVSRAIKRLREKELVATKNLGTATLVAISAHFSKK